LETNKQQLADLSLEAVLPTAERFACAGLKDKFV
jgi:hypothetical protein